MKIKFGFRGQFLGAPEPKKYDNGMSYSISVMHEGDVGAIKCDESVYNRVCDGQFAFGTPCVFTAVYNSDYRSVKIEKLKIDDKAM